jgi:predicted GIY-YIG superfamily endonuclease
MTRTQALIRESAVKTLSRKEKEKLIQEPTAGKYEKG